MPQRVFVVGVGMTEFYRPGKHPYDYPELGKLAVRRALNDSKIKYRDIEKAFCGYVYGDSTCGQRVLYECGMSGIPIVNVNNNCSTGASALYLACESIRGGLSDACLAVGFEKMEKGSLSSKFTDRTNPMDRHMSYMFDIADAEPAPFAPQMFGNAGREHMKLYGTTPEHFAKVAYKNHKHSVNNPYSQFRDMYSLDQILKSPNVFSPLTKLQCCPTSDGGAAAVVVSEKFVIDHGLEDQAIEILAQELTTDLSSTLTGNSCMRIVGYDMTKLAITNALSKAGLSIKDVDVVELHDCFSANELVTYEALGLCPEGQAGKYIDADKFTYGGDYVVNPSGGLISKGHPLGATGLAQCAEIVWQLRGKADKRQVQNAKIGLQHNLGLGGACVVSLFRKYNSRPDGSSCPSDPKHLETFEKSNL